MNHPVLEREALHTVRLTLNGRARSGQARPRLLLSDFLRETAGLKGVHRGCDTAQCGACTVHLDGVAVKTGGTAFQKAVWAALRAIPAGETRSYGQLAAAVGRPKAVRAAGLANGRNRLSIVVPCHRVIGADGSLTGYAGGLWRKKWLLEHENPVKQQSLF